MYLKKKRGLNPLLEYPYTKSQIKDVNFYVCLFLLNDTEGLEKYIYKKKKPSFWTVYERK